MNHFFRTVVPLAGEGDSNCKHTLGAVYNSNLPPLQGEARSGGGMGRGCDKSRSDGVIQNEVVLTRMLHAKFVYPCPHPNPSLTA